MINNNKLKEDLINYCKEYGTPKRLICEYCNITESYLYKWLRDEVCISESLYNKLNDYLDEHDRERLNKR